MSWAEAAEVEVPIFDLRRLLSHATGNFAKGKTGLGLNLWASRIVRCRTFVQAMTSHMKRGSLFMLSELFIRVFVLLLFIVLEYQEPFFRKIHPEEAWLYAYPKTDRYNTRLHLATTRFSLTYRPSATSQLQHYGQWWCWCLP